MSENASDAIKMAGALLLFVMALSVAIFAFTKARVSSEKAMEKLDGTFLYYDTENIYLDYANGAGIDNSIKVQVNQQAIVDKSQFIVNLFNYYKSGYTLLFYYVEPANVEVSTVNGTRMIKIKTDPQKLVLYYSEALPRFLNRSILRVNPENFEINPDGSLVNELVNQNSTENKYRAIYGLDISDEIARQERWIYNDAFINKFVEDLVMGYVNMAGGNDLDKAQSYQESSPSNLTSLNIWESYESAYRYWFKYAYVDHTKNNLPFMKSDCRFIERVGTYNYASSSDIHSTSGIDIDDLTPEEMEKLLSGGTVDGVSISSVINVDASEDLLSNFETIDNYSGAEKKIVQYIYIGEGSDLYS